MNGFPSRRQTKGLNSENLRKFRESEQKGKQKNKQNKIDTIRNKKAAKEILMRDNKSGKESF